jgi:acyl dehydratase
MYLEDLPIGREIDCGRFALTEAEIIDFASRFDPQPWHLDDILARDTYFRGLCASGVHSQAAAIGLVVRAIKGTEIIAGGALNEVRFRAPVRPNHCYRVTACWTEARASVHNPSRGVAVITIVARNAEGEPVMEGGITYIVARRPAEPGSAAEHPAESAETRQEVPAAPHL